MTGPTIKVSADAGAVLAELRKVEGAAERVNQALSAGELEIDAGKAQETLAELEQGAASLAEKLDDAVKAGGELTEIDLDRAAQELENAAKAAEGLERKLTAAGQSGGSASKTARHAKDTADHFGRAAKAQAAMAKDGQKHSLAETEALKRKFDALQSSGTRGTSGIKGKQFDEWVSGGWRDYSVNEREAKRHRDEVMRSIGAQPGAGAGAGHDSTPEQKRSERVGRWSAAAGALGGMAGSMTSGGDGGMWGGAGSAAGSAIGGGLGMMFGGPIGAIAGALGSKLLGGIGSSIDAGIERAGQEGADYTDLRQSLGAAKVDFEDLRGSVRQATDGLGLAYNESAKMARAFGREAGKGAGDIGKEVGSAAGFARGYGMAPEMAAQFFAQMRHLGQTSNERDSKRLALQIGEAVQRGGTSAKMDEVLSAVSGYVSTATKSSMTEANAGAYASFMASMTGLHMPGMHGDPAAAAATMGAADSAMRQGGAFGDASKNFSLGLWQRKFEGFSALDMDYMNEQGAFGSAQRAFGKDSAAYKMAESRGDKGKMRQYDNWAARGGDTSVMAMQMQALEQQFGGNTDGFRKAIQSHFGVGAGQASSIYQAYKADPGLGNLEKQLKLSGIDTGKLNTKQIMSLSELAAGDDASIRKQADKLKGLTGSDALSKEDRAKLEKAQAGGDADELKKVVLGLSAVHDSTRDEGEKQRRVQADMNNAIQKLATELIPLTMSMKDGVIALVEKMAPDSEFAQKAKKARESEKEQDKQDRSTIQVYDKLIAEGRAGVDSAKTPEAKKEAQNQLNQLVKMRDSAVDRIRGSVNYASSDERRTWADGLKKSDGSSSDVAVQNPASSDATSKVKPVEGTAAVAGAKPAKAKKELSQAELDYLAETDKMLGAKSGTSAAQIKVESGNDPNAVSPAGAAGLAQLMPGIKATLEKRFGHKIESRMDQLKAHRYLMTENLRRFGNVPDALRAYNGGWSPGTWGNKETAAYVPKIMATRDADASKKADANPAVGARVGAEQVPQPKVATRDADVGANDKMPTNRLDATKKAGTQQVTVAGEVVVVDQNGKRTGQTVPIKQVGAPVAAGSAA